MTDSKLLAAFMIVTFVCTRLRMNLKYFSAISNIVPKILLQRTHIYHHDKDDDSITEDTIHQEDFLGKLKGEV
jgi:hypothetical protein